MKNKVEAQPRTVNKKNRVIKPIRNKMWIAVLNLLRNINNKKIWKPTGHVFSEVGLKWKPTGRTFNVVGNSCPSIRITSANIVNPKKTTSHLVKTQKSELKVYSRKPKNVKNVGSSKKAKIVESEKANYSEPNNAWGSNATYIPSSCSLFITGYGDYQLGNDTISRLYYVEGLRHNLFSVGQFCHIDLEVAFWKNTCFIRNLEGVDLLSGSKDTNLYTIYLDDMLKTSLICLISKASKTKSWLWHRRLSHLNFGTLNKLAKDGLDRGIPRLKFQKDHMCSVCVLGKRKKSSHQPKAKDTNQEKLYLLHMDLYGPMRVVSINGKRYILVIVDDYSRFTWVRFLRTKDEAPEAIIKCIKNIQVRLNGTVHNVRTDNETKLVNQTLRELYENVGISHQTSVARTPQQMALPKGKTKLFSGLVPNTIPQQPCIPPPRDDWDRLFQPMFDEYFNPPTIAIFPVPVAAAPKAIVQIVGFFLKPTIVTPYNISSIILSSMLIMTFLVPDRHSWNKWNNSHPYEFIKFSVENLVLNPSESEGENACDVPACFTTFSNTLFEADCESDSSDYQSCSDKDFPKEIFSNPLFKEEINSMRIDQHHFNTESDLIESLLNRDSSIISYSSSKIDSLPDEFASELTLLKSIPSGIDETDCYHEEDIRLIERLLYDNSSPRPPEEFVFENSNVDIESFFPSPILNEDSESFMEEIDLSFNLDDLVPPGIEEDDDDSERDMLIHE
nr:retrovirus-related Pol polyprotein from transposon TNT 1-94 [Tanacetum cinerariifolium]